MWLRRNRTPAGILPGTRGNSVGRITRISIMGAAYFIVLERAIDGLETGMDGKNLSRHIESLDATARELGVRPLSDYFSVDPVELAEFMEGEEGEPIDAGDGKLPPLEQFSALEGLATVRALAGQPAAWADDVAQDLRECERILSAAAQRGIGWHFELDI